jgi:hypothetical protein
LNQNLDDKVRVRAFAVLHMIDDTEAKITFAAMENTLSENLKGYFIEFLKNPNVPPWKVPGIYSARARNAAKRMDDAMKKRAAK